MESHRRTSGPLVSWIKLIIAIGVLALILAGLMGASIYYISHALSAFMKG